MKSFLFRASEKRSRLYVEFSGTMLARFRNSFRCVMPKCPAIHIPGMEKPESSAGGESAAELEDRDPNNLNQHLQVKESLSAKGCLFAVKSYINSSDIIYFFN